MGVKIRDIFTFDHVVKGFCSVGEYIIDAARYICDYLLVCKCPERFPQVPKYRQRNNPPPENAGRRAMLISFPTRTRT